MIIIRTGSPQTHENLKILICYEEATLCAVQVQDVWLHLLIFVASLVSAIIGGVALAGTADIHSMRSLSMLVR